MSKLDTLTGAGLVLFLVIVASYVIVVWRTYAKLRPETEKLSVLVARVAAFLPIYALFMFIALNAPNSLVAVNIPIAAMEGYTFYAFFALIVYNLGGPANTVAAFRDSGKPLMCCTSMCPTDPTQYYKKSTWAMFHLMTTRVIVIILAAVASYSKTKAGDAVSALLSLLGAVILFYCLAHLLLMYENIFTNCTNLYGVMKLFLLKFSVGLIVLQGIIEAFMVSFNAEPYTDDSDWNSEDKTIRGYTILVLIEFTILCIPYLWAFTYTISNPPKPIHDESVTMDTNICSFLCKVFNVFDVIGTITYRDELKEPLAENDSNKA